MSKDILSDKDIELIKTVLDSQHDFPITTADIFKKVDTNINLQESIFRPALSNAIANGKLPGYYSVRGRYGGIFRGAREKKQEPIIETVVKEEKVIEETANQNETVKIKPVPKRYYGMAYFDPNFQIVFDTHTWRKYEACGSPENYYACSICGDITHKSETGFFIRSVVSPFKQSNIQSCNDCMSEREANKNRGRYGSY